MSDIKSGFESWFLSIPDVDESLLEPSENEEGREYFYYHIDQMFAGFHGGCKKHDKLTQQVAELRAALSDLVKAEWMVSHDWGGDRYTVIENANKALAETDKE